MWVTILFYAASALQLILEVFIGTEDLVRGRPGALGRHV